jgi:iduronate 2-sulfatase
VPQKVWDLYKTEDIPLATHQLPPADMPGVAYYQGAFYNASNGATFATQVDKNLPVYVQSNMRHAYYAAVSWMDMQVGRVLDELEALDLAKDTAVAFHSDHGFVPAARRLPSTFVCYACVCQVATWGAQLLAQVHKL